MFVRKMKQKIFWLRRDLSTAAYVAQKSCVGAMRWVLRYIAEITTILITLAGWFLITAAVATLAEPWDLENVVWALSGGLLCLSLAGFKFLGRICKEGLYVLAKQDEVVPSPPHTSPGDSVE